MKRIWYAMGMVVGLLLAPTTQLRAAVPPPAIFPAYPVFVLPKAEVGNTTIIHVRPPSEFAAPIKPVQRAEYDITHTPLFYRISIFKSTEDALAAFDYVIAHLPAAHPFLPITQPVAANEHLYHIGNYTVTTATFRNVVLSTSYGVGTAEPVSIGRVLSTEARLFAVAEIYAQRYGA